jgi:ATP-dependent helicase YprA (DUF1998 family)
MILVRRIGPRAPRSQLTWGGAPPAFRFCHAMSEEEEEQLARSMPLDLVSRFDAGPEPNRYFVFRYPQTA